MKSILFVIPTMRMGGAEQSLVSLLNSIDMQKYLIDVLLFEKEGDLTEQIPNNVNVIAADSVTRAMMLEFRYYFKELIKEKHFAAAFARLFMLLNSKCQEIFKSNFIFNWNISKYFIPRQSKKYDIAVGYLEGMTDIYVAEKVDSLRKIGWIHTDFSKQRRNYKAEGIYYNKLDKIVVISEKCKEHFSDYYPHLEERMTVIENITNAKTVIDKSQEEIESNFLNKGYCIVSVGRLEKPKGIDIALSAAVLLRQRGIDFTWHIFGDGILRESLKEKIIRENLEDCFILEGITKNPYKYMRAADIIVQPSRYEGKSIVLDEAKILARPIVVTDYPSARDQIVDGETGIIVDIDAKAIADAVDRLLRDKELAEYLVNNCLKQKDKTEEIINKIEALWESE